MRNQNKKRGTVMGYGIVWEKSLSSALKTASNEDKLVLVDFSSPR
jgi:hypothetical protein